MIERGWSVNSNHPKVIPPLTAFATRPLSRTDATSFSLIKETTKLLCKSGAQVNTNDALIWLVRAHPLVLFTATKLGSFHPELISGVTCMKICVVLQNNLFRLDPTDVLAFLLLLHATWVCGGPKIRLITQVVLSTYERNASQPRNDQILRQSLYALRYQTSPPKVAEELGEERSAHVHVSGGSPVQVQFG